MSDISIFGQDNFGGVQVFDFVPVIDVQSISAIRKENHTITAGVILKTDKTWYRLYSTRGSIKFDEAGKRTPAGMLFEQQISFDVPKDREEIVSLFQQMDQHKFIVKYKDFNEKWKLIGDLQNGLRFLDKFSSGADAPNKNYRDCNFAVISNKRAPFYVNEDFAPIAGIGVMQIGSTFQID